MSAPRIDTLLRTIESVQTLLDELRPHLVDVHELAYDRAHAAAEAKVSGGSRDYALDTNGDQRARDVYIDVAARLVGLGRAAESDLKALKRFLNQDDSRPLRRDGSADVTALEHRSARHSRLQRLARGERHPIPLVSQPERPLHVDPVVELEQLRGAVRRLVKHLDREHTGCKDGEGKRRPRWMDRSSMSPAQRDAFDRSLIRDQDAEAS